MLHEFLNLMIFVNPITIKKMCEAPGIPMGVKLLKAIPEEDLIEIKLIVSFSVGILFRLLVSIKTCGIAESVNI